MPIIAIEVRHSAGFKYDGDEFAKRCDCRKHLHRIHNGRASFQLSRRTDRKSVKEPFIIVYTRLLNSRLPHPDITRGQPVPHS